MMDGRWTAAPEAVLTGRWVTHLRLMMESGARRQAAVSRLALSPAP
jgi:hypothetical protein